MSDCTKAPPGWECTRELGHPGPCAAWPVRDPDPERTPSILHPKPAPVVMPSVRPKGPPPLPNQRSATLLGGTLAPLARAALVPRVDTPRPEPLKPGEGQPPGYAVCHVPAPDHYITDEEPTESRSHAATVNRHMRLYLALPLEDRKLVDAFTIRLQKDAGGG